MAINNKILYENQNGNVGIGETATNGYRLLVKDTTTNSVPLRLIGTNNYNYDFSSLSNGVTNGTRLDISIGSGAGEFSFTNSSGELLRINGSGNVGIGTDSPSTSMDVGLHIKTTAGNSLILEKSSGAALQFRSDATTIRATIAGINEADGLTFHTGAAQTERMRINSAGNVGIGTEAATDAKLTIVKNTSTAYANVVPNISDFGLVISNNVNHVSGGVFSGLKFNLTGDSQNRITYIGAITEDTNRNSSLVFGTDSAALGRTEKMRITSAGNVGIGTALPTAPVDINTSGNTHLIFKYQGSNTKRSFIATNAGVSTAYNGLVIGSNATEQGTQANTGLSSWYQRLGPTDATGDAWSVAYQAPGGSVVELARIKSNGIMQVGGQTGTLQLGNDGTYHGMIEWEYANNELAYTINNVGVHTFNTNGKEVARFTQGNGSGALTLKSNAGNDLIFMGAEGSGGNEENGFIAGYSNGSQKFSIGATTGPTWFKTGQNFGIGVSNPDYDLHVQDDTEANIKIETNNNGPSNFAGLRMFKSRGTYAAPTSVANGDTVAQILIYPRDASGWNNTARMYAKICGTVTSTDTPTDLIFSTGTTGLGDRLIIKSGGTVCASGIICASNCFHSQIVCGSTYLASPYSSVSCAYSSVCLRTDGVFCIKGDDILFCEASVNKDRFITIGPNATWCGCLVVGSGEYQGDQVTRAHVFTTNGNLHIDSANSCLGNPVYTYLQWHAGCATIFGNGDCAQIGCIGCAGNLCTNSCVHSPTICAGTVANIGGSACITTGWFRNVSNNTGLFNVTNALHWYSTSACEWKIQTSAAASQIHMSTCLDATSACITSGYIYANNSCLIGFLNNSHSWVFQACANCHTNTICTHCAKISCGISCVKGTITCGVTCMISPLICGAGCVIADGEFRVDRICGLNIGTDSGQQATNAGGGALYQWGYQAGGPWSAPYPDLVIAFHTGLQLGANCTYGGTRFYSDHPNATGAQIIFLVGCGNCNVCACYDLCATGNVKGAITCGVTCVNSPIVCGTSCLKGVINCGVTCMISPIFCGTSCLKGTITCGVNCVISTIVCASTAFCGSCAKVTCLAGSAQASTATCRYDDRCVCATGYTVGKLYYGFGSYDNDNASSWADWLLLSSYGDSTGGNINFLTINRNAFGMRLYQRGWANSSTPSSTPFGTDNYVEMIHSGNISSYATGTTINNNADNRVITGSGTADTLNGEANLTFNGSTLNVTGAITATGDITSTSDCRVKSDINSIDCAIFIVNGLCGRRYTKDNKTAVGVIAQEVEKVLPEVVHGGESEGDMKSVSYGNITAVLIEAIKEQQKEISVLRKELDFLKSSKEE